MHIWYMLSSCLPSVYANVDVKAQESTAVSKTMFATHVNEMHCNRGEGFEREFKVCVCTCVCVCVYECMYVDVSVNTHTNVLVAEFYEYSNVIVAYGSPHTCMLPPCIR